MNTDKHGFRKKYLWLFTLAVTLPVLFFLIRELTRPQHPQSEMAAVGALRTIHRAALTYEKSYKNGFPARLQTLGPPGWLRAADCNAADLVDEVLAAGVKAGHAFHYTPGPQVEEPRMGCQPGLRTFAITARPKMFEGRSFFVDETGVIRLSSENRAANAQDMTLDEYLNRPRIP